VDRGLHINVQGYERANRRFAGVKIFRKRRRGFQMYTSLRVLQRNEGAPQGGRGEGLLWGSRFWLRYRQMNGGFHLF